ncbi:MAG TPA: right-handed parallel beta-helix repeat-containing protein [Terriglobales bacterium]|nr:right-handed parallel beta-helix repeat-containing protein [Terriglobales bacterium]
MKRRTFLLQSGVGLAAAALPGLGRAAVPGVEGVLGKETNVETVEHDVQRPIVHPGVLQTMADLKFMKAKINAGEEPWKSAWQSWLDSPVASLDFTPKPCAHVVRGAYDVPDKGGHEIQASANAAENHVMQWYVTGHEAHARKAIEIFDAWSGTLADFSKNDAMLLSGWTGGQFCNAAEILRASYSGWSSHSQEQFKRMLLTVYVPLLRMFYPEANGNWDAAIMHTLLAIGIFCEDRGLMELVYRHYRVGLGNSGITRYVYPSGQCEETCRDQGHTQLGLGYLVNTCVMAWNQGVDLFGEADNRLALGIEYTARYMLGGNVPVYGRISTVSRGHFGDLYYAVLQHYRYEKHMVMPYTEKAARKVARPHSIATMYRGDMGKTPAKLKPAPTPSTIAVAAGAQARPTGNTSPSTAISVAPGESIQDALDKLKKIGGGTVSLKAGLHTLPATLMLPSSITIAGTGLDCELILDPTSGHEFAMVNAEPDMHDVVLRDLVIEGAQKPEASHDPNGDVQRRRMEYGPSRAGIVLQGDGKTMMRNVRFEHITVRNCTYNAVELFGVEQVEIVDCNISRSGGMVPPGHGKNHNLKMNHIAHVAISGSRFDDSMWGHGIAVIFGRDIRIRDCEIARNALDGVMIAESRQVTVEGCLAEGNGGAGIAQERWMDPNQGSVIKRNVLRNNVVVR